MTETLEIERKYDAEPAVEPSLDGLPGVAEVTAPERVRLEAVYHDTEDLRLARAGVSLRRRSGGDDDGWHLKLPTGRRGERLELRLPLGEASSTPPDELVDLTLATTRGAPLHPVARLDTTRTRRRLLADDGSTLAEVVSDQVNGQTLGASSTLTGWHELEVELAGGPKRLLDAVDARLREFGATPSESTSKIGRLLDVTPGHRHARKRKPAAGDVVLDYLNTQVERLVAADPRVRRDEPDAVHDMRVAARRARSTLRSFRRVLDRERTADLVEELRWLGRALAGARDAEVQHAHMLRDLRELPDELALGPVRARIDSHFAQERAQSRAALLTELRGPRYLALLDRLHELLHDPPLTDLAARPPRKVLPSQVARAQRRVRRRMNRRYHEHPHALDRNERDAPGRNATAHAAAMRGLTGHPAASLDAAKRDAGLHEARKAAKRARYAADVLPGKRAKRSARRLKQVQRLLGDHQDAVVAGALLRELGVRAHLDGENGFSFGLLLGQHRARAKRLRELVPSVWRRADKPKVRRWMS